MPNRLLAVRAAVMALAIAGASFAHAQLQPERPLRIVTTGVGGGTDLVARIVASGLTETLGRTVIVDNRGSSVVPGDVVSKATPDGHTLLLTTSGLAWILPLFQKVPYDPVKGFSPVALVAGFPAVMTINAALPANSVKEFIAVARARQGGLNYVMTAPGGSAHLSAELFKHLAKVQLTAVPYKNTGTAITDLISGQVQVFFTAAGPVMAHVKAGRLKALAVTSAKRSGLLPDLPTVGATVPGYDMEAFYCLFAPAGTPRAVIDQLHQGVARALGLAEIRNRFVTAGIEPRGSSPAALGALRDTDMARMSRFIRDAGLAKDIGGGG